MSGKWTIIMLAALTGGASAASALDLRDQTFDTAAGKVVFSHKTHLKKNPAKAGSLTCKNCHNSSQGSNRRYRMTDMEKGKSCGSCHAGRQAFALGNCSGCHQAREITFQVKETGTVHFSHARHLQEMQCPACHPGIYATGSHEAATMAAMKRGGSCGACHDGDTAFAIARCYGCHPTREIVFRVKQAGPTVFSHQSHIKRYSCSACHTGLYRLGENRKVTMADMKKGKSCGACHDKRTAFSVAECQKCHPVRDVDFKVADAGNVKFSHRAHLAMYKCDACHTRTFPLKRGKRPVSMSEMEKSKSCGACHDGKAAFSVKENCEMCHGHS